jgi:cephalosporin hydroxylase
MVSCTYEQQNNVVVYMQNSADNSLCKILNKCGVVFSKVSKIDVSNNDESLYIISGDLIDISKLSLPKNYILHHTGSLSKKDISHNSELLSKAIAVWDISWANINKYKKNVKNFYYLPGADYQFLDPVILPCFLSAKELSSYRNLLVYGNSVDTDISSHLPSLFYHCCKQKPSFIVELGVRGGESTIALHEASVLNGALLLGVDIDNCAAAYSKFSDSLFVQMDDTQFTLPLSQLPQLPKTIDFLFIDTSHQYAHTMKELSVFVSLLSEHGTVAFHDSNVTPLGDNSGYARLNGTSQSGIYGNPRGVTEAIKEFFGLSFNEYDYLDKKFISRGFEWHVIHYPFCNGFTVIQKIDKA